MRSFVVLAATAVCAFGAVTEVHVVDRTDVRVSPGGAGPYERIAAKAYFAVDPKNPANRIVTDIDLAPKNDSGLVEFSADVIVVKPRDPAKGNGTILFEVSNRGGMGMLRMFDPGDGEYGDRYLLDQGYTLVWVGWQFDVPEKQPLKVYVPIATANGKPIVGLVRAQFIPMKPTTSMPLADRNHVPYAPVDRNEKAARLTVRSGPTDPAVAIARDAWRFVDDGNITMAAGFEPGKVYELVYTSQNPPVVGLGMTAVRDFIAYLKYGGTDSTWLLSDQRRYLKRAIGFGTSQSGRFLRTFLYYGFNGDEKNRKVFDGVWAHVAGAGRGSFNLRFAQPSRDGHPLLNLNYPTDLFPYTDLPETDPETGITAGLLDKVLNTPFAPKIVYTNGSYEYWGRGASLIHTSADGKSDAPLPADTRIYFLAGTQHGPGAQPRRTNTQQLANPSDYRWTMRALLASVNAWLKDGVEPPASQYPRVDKDQLAPFYAVPFPSPRGFKFPKDTYHSPRLDFGPEFATKGIMQEPPKIGKPFPQLIPRVDINDGNEIAGIRSIDLRVPVATYTGWNLRSPEIGAPDVLFDMIGSFIPLAKTKAERERNGDRRPSIEERYASKEDYLNKVKQAAADLVKERFLLPGDVDRVADQAAARWDLVMR